jgi:phenylalanyl-tRNA synthetase beta chain
MIFLKEWLEDYIDLKSVDNIELEKIITSKIAEVDDVTLIDDWFYKKVVVGKIKNIRKHPEADNLNIFEIDFGGRLSEVTIVSAAENAKDGLICPVALNGCKLPFMTIAPRKLRGIESNGMCCGKSELMLETEMSSGLWSLTETKNIQDQDLGKSICEVFPEIFNTYTVLDIKILPDKFSLIGSHLGLSLDMAIALENYDLLTDKAKNLLDEKLVDQNYKEKLNTMPKSDINIEVSDETPNNYVNSFDLFQINLQDTEYNLPHLIQQRMFLTGRNLVGNLTDLSNYLIADVGQPSHFFNGDKIIKPE